MSTYCIPNVWIFDKSEEEKIGRLFIHNHVGIVK